MIAKMNKKGWVAKDYVFATLIFSAVIALMVVMVSSIANDYDNDEIINEEFSEEFDKFSENKALSESMYEAVNSETGLSLIGVFEIFPSSGSAGVTAVTIYYYSGTGPFADTFDFIVNRVTYSSLECQSDTPCV